MLFYLIWYHYHRCSDSGSSVTFSLISFFLFSMLCNSHKKNHTPRRPQTVWAQPPVTLRPFCQVCVCVFVCRVKPLRHRGNPAGPITQHVLLIQRYRTFTVVFKYNVTQLKLGYNIFNAYCYMHCSFRVLFSVWSSNRNIWCLTQLFLSLFSYYN